MPGLIGLILLGDKRIQELWAAHGKNCRCCHPCFWGAPPGEVKSWRQWPVQTFGCTDSRSQDFCEPGQGGLKLIGGTGSGLQIFSASIHSPPLKLRQLVRSTGQRARRYGWTRRLEFMQGHAVHRLRGGSAPGKKPCLFRVLRDMDCRIGQPEESLALVCRARCRKAACQVVVGRGGIGVRHDQPLPSRSAIHG